MIVKKTN